MSNVSTNPSSAFFYKYAVFIFTLAFASGLYGLWLYWPKLIITSMHWQRGIYSELSDLLASAQDHLFTVSLSLIGLSFFYGALHSLGPGHGKLIVSTYLATHPTKVKVSLMLTVVSALLQAVVAIVLVSTLLLVFNASMREVNNNANSFITYSFYIVLLLGVSIVWRHLRALWRLLFAQRNNVNTHVGHDAHDHHDHDHHGHEHHEHAHHGDEHHEHAHHGHEHHEHDHHDHAHHGHEHHEHDHHGHAHHEHDHHDHEHHDHHGHDHSDGCGCGHQHFVEADQINKASSLKEYVIIIFSIGIRPCTGAIMVLLFANLAGIYWLGVVSAFAMAIGTALTTSVIAILTITGKKIINYYLANKHPHGHKVDEAAIKSRAITGVLCRLSGGILLILIGFILLSSQPVGMSPVF